MISTKYFRKWFVKKTMTALQGTTPTMPLILGIESSCDETSIALLEKGKKLVAQATAAQKEVHERWGGVVPELASRKHTENILPTLRFVMEQSGRSYEDIGALAVTACPGLLGSLMVGVSAAKSLAYALDKPLILVNHLEAHLAAIFLERSIDISYPALGLIISGGHTSLYEIDEDFTVFRLLGHTLDDAAGEAFDKGARLLGLGYPGGPEIARMAQGGNPKAIAFPRAIPQKSSYNFSFSGLKTALAHYVQENKNTVELANVCASYQEAIADALLRKLSLVVKDRAYRDVIVAGGVAANLRIRQKIREAISSCAHLHIPEVRFCTDNGAMVAAMGSILYKKERYLEGEEIFSVLPSPRVEAKSHP